MSTENNRVPILGWEEFYEISSDGKVYSKPRRVTSGNKYKTRGIRMTKFKEKKPFKTKNGYLVVELKNNRMSEKYSIHRLVAIHYLENPNNYLEVNHKDGNKNNNHRDNLEWINKSGNMKHSYDIGIRKPANSKAIESRSEFGEIRNYKSITEAAKELKLTRSCISDCLAGKQKQTGGYTFKYITKLLGI